MKRRRGSILAESIVCLLLLAATSGSLAMLASSLASGRAENKQFTTERLTIESAAELLLATDLANLEIAVQQISNEGRFTLISTSDEYLGVTATRLRLQSKNYRQLELTVWRFDQPEESVKEPSDEP